MCAKKSIISQIIIDICSSQMFSKIFRLGTIGKKKLGFLNLSTNQPFFPNPPPKKQKPICCVTCSSVMCNKEMMQQPDRCPQHNKPEQKF
jgi:hypothetical protein